MHKEINVMSIKCNINTLLLSSFFALMPPVFQAAPALAADYELTGGSGQNSSVGGADGASVRDDKAGAFAVDGTTLLTGGAGGAAGGAGTGGAGGSAALSVGGTFSSQGNVGLEGGQGGAGTLGTGGAGGNAALRAAFVDVAGTFHLQSGAKGTDGGGVGGAGGSVELETYVLRAPLISLARPADNAGSLRFNVGTLNVSRNTVLELERTLAADVRINGLSFANGSGLTVRPTPGSAMTFGGNLSVAGSGNTLDSPIPFDAAGRNLFFNLAGVADEAVMLRVAQPGALNIAGARVSFAPFSGGGSLLPPGWGVTLIEGADGMPTTGYAYAQKGITLRYGFALDMEDGNLYAGLTSVSASPEAKALSEGRLGSLVFVNQGADLVAGKGMEAARSAGQVNGIGLGAFAAVSGGWSQYNSGSHIDVAGASLIAGLAWNPAIEYGRFTLGAFFEAGWGGYNTYNSFTDYGDANGNGNTQYYGGGLLARYELPCGLYAEASGRVGGVRNEYDNSDLRDPISNRKASYDLNSTYYGAHAGLGYNWIFSEKAKLDIYAKYLWTHMTGQSTHVADDPITFQDMNSHRVRGGARFTYAVNEFVLPYIGAAWEWEFDGRARATTYGYNISTPDVTGGTGIGELGLSVKPFAKSAGAAGGLSFDLAVQGYAGVRQGVSGTFQAKWEF